MSYKQYGGINNSNKHMYVHASHLSADKLDIQSAVGLQNTKYISDSHYDLNNNSILNAGSIIFSDGTVQTTAFTPGSQTFYNLTVENQLSVLGDTFLQNTYVQADLSVSGDTTLNALNATTGTFTGNINADTGTITALNATITSTLKSNKILPNTGTNINIGETGNTVTINDTLKTDIIADKTTTNNTINMNDTNDILINSTSNDINLTASATGKINMTATTVVVKNNLSVSNELQTDIIAGKTITNNTIDMDYDTISGNNNILINSAFDINLTATTVKVSGNLDVTGTLKTNAIKQYNTADIDIDASLNDIILTGTNITVGGTLKTDKIAANTTNGLITVSDGALFNNTAMFKNNEYEEVPFPTLTPSTNTNTFGAISTNYNGSGEMDFWNNYPNTVSVLTTPAFNFYTLEDNDYKLNVMTITKGGDLKVLGNITDMNGTNTINMDYDTIIGNNDILINSALYDINLTASTTGKNINLKATTVAVTGDLSVTGTLKTDVILPESGTDIAIGSGSNTVTITKLYVPTIESDSSNGSIPINITASSVNVDGNLSLDVGKTLTTDNIVGKTETDNTINMNDTTTTIGNHDILINSELYDINLTALNNINMTAFGINVNGEFQVNGVNGTGAIVDFTSGKLDTNNDPSASSDYDVRLQTTGGTSGSGNQGQGELTLIAKNFSVSNNLKTITPLVVDSSNNTVTITNLTTDNIAGNTTTTNTINMNDSGNDILINSASNNINLTATTVKVSGDLSVTGGLTFADLNVTSTLNTNVIKQYDTAADIDINASSNDINLTGTNITINGLLETNTIAANDESLITVSNDILFDKSAMFKNNGNKIPPFPSNVFGAISTNVEGQGEMDFWNDWTVTTPNSDAFNFYVLTGALLKTNVITITNGGDLKVLGKITDMGGANTINMDDTTTTIGNNDILINSASNNINLTAATGKNINMTATTVAVTGDLSTSGTLTTDNIAGDTTSTNTINMNDTTTITTSVNNDILIKSESNNINLTASTSTSSGKNINMTAFGINVNGEFQVNGVGGTTGAVVDFTSGNVDASGAPTASTDYDVRLRTTAGTSGSGNAGQGDLAITANTVTVSNDLTVKNELTFIDSTTQLSAYTGAGVLVGSYTNTDITIDGNGKITNISNGSNTYVGIPYYEAYIKDYTGQYTGQYPSTINFSFDGNSWDSQEYFTIRVNIEVTYNFSGSIAQNMWSFNGNINIYPNRVPAPEATPLSTPSANINNEINGNDSYIYTNDTYAPSGRYYWSHGITYTGSNPEGVFLYCAGEQNQIGFQIINPNNRTSGLKFDTIINCELVNKGANSSPIGIVTGTGSSYARFYSQGF